MAKSFRRILLSRLLMLSVPIILLGVSTTYFVTYRKARSGLLETARQNLTESAVRRGKEITNAIDALKSNMVAASHTTILRSGDRQQYAAFLEQLSKQFPTQIECLQLIDTTTQKSIESTCESEVLTDFEPTFWPQQQKNSLLPLSQVDVRPILPENGSDSETNCKQRETTFHINPLKLLVSVPIYDSNKQLNSVLIARSVILEPHIVKPGSLAGNAAIINGEGMIIAHPCLERVGQNIEQELEEDSGRLQEILKKAQAGEQNFIHLFSFEKKEVELLAGYTGIPNPISAERNQVWVVLTMTPLKDALAALDDIQQVLLILLSSLTCALILGTIIVILYVSREIAKPLEGLISTINEKNFISPEPIPDNFKVHEFNQLARAFNKGLDEIRASSKIASNTLEKALKTAGEMQAATENLERANETLKQTEQKLTNTLHAEQLANDRLQKVLPRIFDRLVTPLAGLIGNLSFVEEYFDEIAEENEDLELAYKSALLLHSNLRELSRMFSGVAHKIKSVDLNNILDNINEEYRPKIEQKGLEFHLQKWRDREFMVLVDPDKFIGILKVLIDNAICYTESGQISIRIQVENVDSQTQMMILGNEACYPTGQKACIVIQDTGCGMDGILLDRINSDGSNKKIAIGLSVFISKIIMEMMNGKIVFDSEGEGKGTNVQLCLPTAKRYDVS